ncbi:MAG TPA: beta-glucanase [Balneolaceae bacterium]|nr:beta-glucanase [Balneolaceae bacterium]
MRSIKSTFFLLLISILVISTGCKSNNTGGKDELDGHIWSDEFDGNRYDRENWYPELGAHGWGNNELQEYTGSSDNIVVSDGTLKIVANLEGDGQNVGDYTSARLLTYRTFHYGRIEIRAKIPADNGNGLWPAIWMLGDGIRNGVSWPDCGEIDIMEYVSYAPNQFYCTIHSAANNHSDGTQLGSGALVLDDIEEEFHNYGIIWTEDYIKFYLDEPTNTVYRVNKPADANTYNWPFSQPHFILLNMAVGGDWGGAQGVDDSIFPATFEIDYVRYFELEE